VGGGNKWRKNFIDNKNDMEIKWPGCNKEIIIYMDSLMHADKFP